METSPISIAEQLLELVRRVYVPVAVGPNPRLSASEIYETKYLIEDLCGKLLRSVLGPLEYTTLLAGQYAKLFVSSSSPLWKNLARKVLHSVLSPPSAPQMSLEIM